MCVNDLKTDPSMSSAGEVLCRDKPLGIFIRANNLKNEDLAGRGGIFGHGQDIVQK